MEQRRVADLAYRFQRQVAFAEGYSPLYARLFRLFEDWLTSPGYAQDPLVRWLVTVSEGRKAFSVTNLLLAAIHRQVLAGADDAAELARFFATVGGTASVDAADAGDIPRHVRTLVLHHQQELAHFIQTANVQTNETGRGLAWLFPLLHCTWERVQLVDLGASAGLNLVADQRAYTLTDAFGQTLLSAGAHSGSQFLTACRGELGALPQSRQLPVIESRLGCDVMPFQLETTDDELTLKAFVWGDQPQRLKRLQEGIAAYHTVQNSNAPVRLKRVDLPGELASFLQSLEETSPLVLYNTYMTVYLEDKGFSMRRIIDEWAREQHRDVLWLQWEPAYGHSVSPGYGWCAWTADLWHWSRQRRHRQWQLGWVHPHGTEAQFEDGLAEWAAYWV